MTRGILAAFLFAAVPLVFFFHCLPAFSAEQELRAVPPEEPQARDESEPVPTEIVGFYLRGKYNWEKTDILDLDVFFSDSGLRLIPLKRILKRLEVEYTESDGRLLFTTHSGESVDIDLDGSIILVGGEAMEAEFVTAVSDYSFERDTFLEAEALAEIMGFSAIEWDEVEYAFRVETEKSLPIWKIEEGVSLFSIETEAEQVVLPELFPPAKPEKSWATLDFVELRASGRVKAIDETAGDATLGGLGQTFWGWLAQGRYKLRLAEEPLRYTDGVLEESEDPFITVPHAEWKYEFKDSDLLLGDSTFGLNDLVYPSIRLSGARLNGIIGGNATRSTSDYGLRHRFLRPLVFQGLARVGSQVELFINDRLVETEEVLVDLPGRPGMGRYRFEDVELAPGSINEVRIRITDPDGVVTVVEEDVLGTSVLLPKGALAYVAGIGGNRDADQWGMRGIIGGGRLFYGISDKVTAGLTFAAQEDYYDSRTSVSEDERDNPENSRHVGAQLAVQPLDFMVLEADVAWMNYNGRVDERGKGGGKFDDLAYFLKGNAQPVGNLELDALYFLYGPDYFNGNNIDLRDRRGYVAGAQYSPLDKVTLRGAQAVVSDNVEGQEETTREAAVQHLEISTGYIPRSTLTISRDLIDPDWEDGKDIYTVELRSRPLQKWNVFASHSEGHDLTLEDNSDFFSGLRLPGVSVRETRNTEVAVSRQILEAASLTGRYRRSQSSEQASLVFSASSLLGLELQTRSEFGWDYEDQKYFFDHRTEYKLPGMGGTRIGFETEFRQEEWSGALFIAIDELFDLTGDGVKHVSDDRIKPDSGMLLGRVFVDADADGVLDADEPGVAEVEVILDDLQKVTSGEDGYYFFPAPSPDYVHRLRVNPETVPAIYVCTHCTQGAFCGRGSQTTVVNFGMAPSHAVVGTVRIEGDPEKEYAKGVQIIAEKESGEVVSDSITAQDGSFYIGNVLPGKYRLVMQNGTIPAGYEAKNLERNVEIPPSLDWQEIEVEDFVLEAVEAQESTE
jgi:hypothetical protein